MERYKITKNGAVFAVFHEGDPSGFGKPFTSEVALREFRACVDFWELNGVRAKWILIIEHDNTPAIGRSSADPIVDGEQP